MKLCVIGTGYVGLVSTACFAEMGHEVIGVDIDEAKVKKLQQGECPIFEPGLPKMLQKHLKRDAITFTTNLDTGIRSSEIIMAAVGTPVGQGRRADLSQVENVCRTIGKHAEGEKIFVMKSTVPVGTSEKCRMWVEEEMLAHRSPSATADGEGGEKRKEERGKKKVSEEGNLHLVSNPEFLREGKAVRDFLEPDRIVVGFRDEKAGQKMRELYKPLIEQGTPYLEMSVESAELTKYASNAFLTTKISFINFIANLCEASGADVRDVAKGMGLDHRIGEDFLEAGIGYGGSCFPKDVQALIKTADNLGVPSQLLRDVEAINETQRDAFVRKVEESLGSVRGKTLAVWGLSFKPDTDDMRSAPSIDIVTVLFEKGAMLKVYDPVSMEGAKTILPSGVTFVLNAEEALRGAEALLLLTEWKEFREWKAENVAKTLRGKFVFDGRNVFHPEAMRKAGLTYFGVGRP